jgi:acetyl-CoA carboxylase carboxyltransferase component
MNRLALGWVVAGLSPSDNLDAFRKDSFSPGDRSVIKEMRDSGSNTARERILGLLDDDSFVEIDSFVRHRSGDYGMHLHTPLGDGVVAGHGMLDGRRVACFSQDFSVFSGTMGEMHAKKICKIVEFAEKASIPLIGVWDGDGQRAHEGVTSLGPNGELLDNLVSCSGKIPMISIILGTVSGTSALAAGLSDFIILGKQRGRMFMRSPYVIPEIVAGEVDEDTLGGANHHASRSGVACLVSDSEREAFDMAAEILSYMPDHTMSDPPNLVSGDKWDRECKGMEKLVPEDSDRPYDMRGVFKQVFDDERFLELFPAYAENLVIGFARLDGMPVGVIGNQPSVLAGCLDIDASVKAARFIRTCDSFNIPIVTFVDVPGFLPGTVQEWGGIIRHGAKMLYAYAEATVPKLTVVTRKAYGGAYLAMSCKHLGSDYNVSWPTGELAVMGAEGAVKIIHRAELAESDDSSGRHAELVDEYREKFGDPYVAARHGWLDDVIEPSQTRRCLVRALRPLLSKRELLIPKKHGNIPL